MKSIGDEAFYDCQSLVEVINKSALIIKRNSLYSGYAGCYAFQVITDEKDSRLYQEDDFIFYKDSNLGRILVRYVGTKANVEIPGNVAMIHFYAFFGCSNLTNLRILRSVTSIGGKAFSGCSNLANIYYNGSIEQWNKIEKYPEWNTNTGSYVIHCTNGNIDK